MVRWWDEWDEWDGMERDGMGWERGGWDGMGWDVKEGNEDGKEGDAMQCRWD